ncbi:MAG: hypothetical protein H7Z37_13830, partial [Pyrinomonadaceae bacterium]|nr:hypothetical protein [Pyrinomonadaceae bacterium]
MCNFLKAKRFYCVRLAIFGVCAAVCFLSFSIKQVALNGDKSRKTIVSQTSQTVETQRDVLSSPIYFEENRGQFDNQVKFVAQKNGQILFLTDRDATFVVPFEDRKSRKSRKSLIDKDESSRFNPVTINKMFALKMKLSGANDSFETVALDEQNGKINRFRGVDVEKWLTDIPTFAKIKQ